MKHSIAVKFVAIILCALSVVSIAACGFGILFMENWNLYNMPLETLKNQQKLHGITHRYRRPKRLATALRKYWTMCCSIQRLIPRVITPWRFFKMAIWCTASTTRAS